jgi:AcrR family transcriptional regulator
MASLQAPGTILADVCSTYYIAHPHCRSESRQKRRTSLPKYGTQADSRSELQNKQTNIFMSKSIAVPSTSSQRRGRKSVAKVSTKRAAGGSAAAFLKEGDKAGSARLGSVKSRSRRAPEDTRMALLNAAVIEFAREGYGGARVDRISKAAKSNDRMLYYYFQSKEKLFNQVIEHCYEKLVASEEALVLDLSKPRTALADLVAFNWAYYWEHPELLSILAAENLFKGRHIKNKIRRVFASSQFAMLDRVLKSGIEDKAFRPDCDTFLVYMSILSLTYFYRSNLYTLSNYMQIDLADLNRRNYWLLHTQGMIDDLVRRP